MSRVAATCQHVHSMIHLCSSRQIAFQTIGDSFTMYAPSFFAPQDHCPSMITFVLKETEPENWLNDGGVDFTVTLKPPNIDTIVDQVR